MLRAGVCKGRGAHPRGWPARTCGRVLRGDRAVLLHAARAL